MVSVRRVMLGKRTAFTLVELLVAIGIIGFMAGMVVFTMAGAQTDAKIARTEATIQKLNTIIMEKWEGYRYRAVDLGVAHKNYRKTFDSGSSTYVVPLEGRVAALYRLYMLRDIMRMEMPDNKDDLIAPLSFTVPLKLGAPVTATTPTTNEYAKLASYFLLKPDIEPAECLYAIVSGSSVNGVPAIENFRPSEIGDIDDDGLPEFIDAWGNRIGWVRWPNAFESELQTQYQNVPDAFDPLRLDGNWTGAGTVPGSFPWTLVPLIVSAGPDGSSGLSSTVIPFDLAHKYSPFGSDIYTPTVADITDAAAASDNITNHDLMVRQY